MQVINTMKMFSITVKNMKKSKAFYVETLGLKVTKEHREDDDNWWVTVEFPGGGTIMTLARAANYGADEPLTPGMIGLYFTTSDIEATHEELDKKSVKVGRIMDDLFGPGSGVKFFNIEDPDGNSINVLEEK
jgi:catechol 2,3-dioxygenase-like lactoylglutathione lyase family enzyme